MVGKTPILTDATIRPDTGRLLAFKGWGQPSQPLSTRAESAVRLRPGSHGGHHCLSSVGRVMISDGGNAECEKLLSEVRDCGKAWGRACASVRHALALVGVHPCPRGWISLAPRRALRDNPCTPAAHTRSSASMPHQRPLLAMLQPRDVNTRKRIVFYRLGRKIKLVAGRSWKNLLVGCLDLLGHQERRSTCSVGEQFRVFAQRV
jgi:hypothetical protein